ncbi:hypothetical protein BJ742DRAFT_880454 [Cladochytrium replicatum]|nr:hypothetical protein BJ742DRAFT_880454 [Cladochytrium replicatum]
MLPFNSPGNQPGFCSLLSHPPVPRRLTNGTSGYELGVMSDLLAPNNQCDTTSIFDSQPSLSGYHTMHQLTLPPDTWTNDLPSIASSAQPTHTRVRVLKPESPSYLSAISLNAHQYAGPHVPVSNVAPNFPRAIVAHVPSAAETGAQPTGDNTSKVSQVMSLRSSSSDESYYQFTDFILPSTPPSGTFLFQPVQLSQVRYVYPNQYITPDHLVVSSAQSPAPGSFQNHPPSGFVLSPSRSLGIYSSPSSFAGTTGLSTSTNNSVFNAWIPALIQPSSFGGQSSFGVDVESFLPANFAVPTYTPSNAASTSLLNSFGHEASFPLHQFSGFSPVPNGFGSPTQRKRPILYEMDAANDERERESGEKALASNSSELTPSCLTLDTHTDKRQRIEDTPNATAPFLWNPSEPDEFDRTVRSYLMNPSRESTVYFFYPVVAQKSYGVEKRFMTPPPVAIAMGNAWTQFCRQEAGATDSALEFTTDQSRSTGDEASIPLNMAVSFEEPTSNSFQFTAAMAATDSSTTENGEETDREGFDEFFGPNNQSVEPSFHTDDEGGDDDDYIPSGRGRRIQAKKKRIAAAIRSADTPIGLSESSKPVNHDALTTARLMRFCGPSAVQAQKDEIGARAAIKLCWRGLFRNVYVTDATGAKTFNLFLGVRTQKNHLVNILVASAIKVISKPSKNIRDGVRSGSFVAIYNRIRAQTISTKYLCICSEDRQELAARNDHWDAFIIWNVDDPRYLARGSAISSSPTQDERVASCGLEYVSADARHSNREKILAQLPRFVLRKRREGLDVSANEPALPKPLVLESMVVCYDDVVVLEHIDTGLQTVKLIVRRTEGRDKVIISKHGQPRNTEEFCGRSGEPVTQLNKVAFEICGKPGSFLQVVNEGSVGLTPGNNGTSGQRKGASVRLKDGRTKELIPENALWTVINVAPMVSNVVPTAGSTALVFNVSNFNPTHAVYFGPIRAASITHRPEEGRLIVHIPVVDVNIAGWLIEFETTCTEASAQRAGFKNVVVRDKERTGVTVPILVVGNGVVYRTSFYHRFCFEFVE